MRAAFLGALLVAGGTAGVAWAAPDRSGSVGPGHEVLEWDGAPVTGTPLGRTDDDDTLVEVTEAGAVSIRIDEVAPRGSDLDLYVFRAKSDGMPDGPFIAASETAEGDGHEQIERDLPPGRYLVRVNGFLAAGATYRGTVTFVPRVLPPGDPAAGSSTAVVTATPASTAQAPEARIEGLPSRAPAAKLRAIRGTAKDDRGVAQVGVAVVQVQSGGRCRQLRRDGSFTSVAKCAPPTAFARAKGTARWSYALPRRLPAGDYVVYARAQDAAGVVQKGFTARNRRAVRVG